MNSLHEILEASPQFQAATNRGQQAEAPQPLGSARWDWSAVNRVLVVRLRSIGDTVLTTPSLYALKRFVPNVQVDILLESWVAPVLDGFEFVDNVITLEKGSTASRARVARELRSSKYDVVYNLHGGTTSTLMTRATGAKHRVGYAAYQYSRLHQHLAPPASLLWGKEKTHSVEQQLALLGWTGVPVTDRPRTQLAITPQAQASIETRLLEAGIGPTNPFVLIHPAAAFATKQWAVEKFARVAEMVSLLGLSSIVITSPAEQTLAVQLKSQSKVPIFSYTNLSLPEVSALASKARLFVGNDSGIAHMAAAVGAPSVVIFGSSNIHHWSPWATAPAEVVREELECQPCHGYFCEKFEQPECIMRVPVEQVSAAVVRVLRASAT
jgi:lipopolysaccharide heptosyltransferase II